MSNESSNRIQLLQGTLGMLILRTLLFGPAHGHQIAKHIQRTTDDLLQVEHGSLYPALHRLERKGWLAAKWEPAGKDLKREYKYYRLTGGLWVPIAFTAKRIQDRAAEFPVHIVAASNRESPLFKPSGTPGASRTTFNGTIRTSAPVTSASGLMSIRRGPERRHAHVPSSWH
jgi:transcriptional regulator